MGKREWVIRLRYDLPAPGCLALAPEIVPERATSWAICTNRAASVDRVPARRHLMPMMRFPPPFNGIDRMRQLFCIVACMRVIMVTRSLWARMDSTSDRLLVWTQLSGHGTPSV